MSERYGKCKTCRGRGMIIRPDIRERANLPKATPLDDVFQECDACHGEGCSGNADDLRETERRSDDDVERRTFPWDHGE
jgi:excinuclease UvrABC ATPase subunit